MSGTISMGAGTHELPLSLFRDNRNRLCGELRKINAIDDKTFVLLKGGETIPFYDTDTEYGFRQVNKNIVEN